MFGIVWSKTSMSSLYLERFRALEAYMSKCLGKYVGDMPGICLSTMLEVSVDTVPSETCLGADATLSKGKVPIKKSKSPELMKKTEAYQRAVHVMLHQSDAAKFALRDGKNDKAIVRRLEILKCSRASKLFQSIAWHSHARRDRATTWETMSEATSDSETTQTFDAAFEGGRMPIFEPLPVAGGEPLAQRVHMSSQELQLHMSICSYVHMSIHMVTTIMLLVNIQLPLFAVFAFMQLALRRRSLQRGAL